MRRNPASDTRPAGDRSTTRMRRPLGYAALTLTVGLAGLALTGCADEDGSGDPATYAIDNFEDPEITGIDVQDDFDVNVVVDPSQPQAGSITIDDNLLDRGYAHVDDGVLTIAFDGWGDVNPTRMPLVTLRVQSLDTIENHGKGHVVVTGIDEGEVEVVNTDNGEIAVTGRADTVTVRSTSDGAVNLTGLVARHVELDDTDDGPIVVTATEVVDGSISGDADVVVLGNPDSTDDIDLDGDGQLVTRA
jgi:hypothetical protein